MRKLKLSEVKYIFFMIAQPENGGNGTVLQKPEI